MLPVRCFSCNKVIGRYDKSFRDFLDRHASTATIPYQEFFDEVELRRYCCRKIFLTHVDPFHQETWPEIPHVEVRKHTEVKKILIAR